MKSASWTCVLVGASLSLFPQQAARGQGLQPGERIDYRPLAFEPDRWEARELDTHLVPWLGRNVVLLTTTAELDPVVMATFVGRLDAGWQLYADLVGQSPRRWKHWKNLPTIAAIPDAELTCGYGCGYLGHTGIEVAGFYDSDYPLAKQTPDAFAHYYFYEMGRNYYVFGGRHSAFTTGFAVFMRYVCMDTLRCEDPDLGTRKTIERCESLYAQSSIPFLRAFANLPDSQGEKVHRLVDGQGREVVPSDQPCMYATAMLKLRREYGGDEWVKRFHAALAKCPELPDDTREGVLGQSFSWLVAASIAARQDLTPVFVGRWRLPLAESTRAALANVDWTAADMDPAELIAGLPVEFLSDVDARSAESP